ncbi:hypothetical protein V6N13_014257 [Hibiscus sabdariffa]
MSKMSLKYLKAKIAEEQEVSPRKPRLAATGVADLMNQLKPKAREIKAKKKKKVKEEVLYLLETRVKERNAISIIKARFSGWSWFNNYEEASNGCIWNLVRGSWKFEKVFQSDQLITCYLSNGSDKLCPSAVSPHESFDYDGSQSLSGAMQEFLDCQEDLDVFDHSYIGSFFTWCNFREEAPLLRKLDRVLVEHPNFLKIVEDFWVQPSGGNPLQLLFTKLKRLKGPLKQYNKEVFGDLSTRVQAHQVELKNLQKNLLMNPSGENLMRERVVAKELHDLYKAEEQFFRHKSRIQYIREGDKNSSFFFRQVAARQKFSMITMLKDSQGHKLESFEAISNELVNHFVGSLGAIDENVEVVQDNLLKEVLGVELTVDMQNSLVSPVTNEEIKDVVFSMNGNKAPGPDGYSARFFSAVSSAVITICKLLGEEAVYLWGVEKQVDRLQTELKWMRSSLMVADVKQDEDERIRLWVAEIRELAYDAEDVIEDFVLRVGSKRKGGVSGCIKRSACILNEGREVHETRSKIEEIIERILDLVRRLQVYGVKGLRDGEGSSYLSVRRELRRPYPHIMDQNVVGLNDVIKELVPKLVEERTQCRLVSIWGMGGLGKTTLAKKLYHHSRVTTHFQHLAFVFVSQQFQTRKVWEDILSGFKKLDADDRKLNDEQLASKLFKLLKDEKCLVILDDIWSIEAWDRLKPAFPAATGIHSNSKILLTTRNKEIVSHADRSGYLYELPCLNDEESWELLQKVAFPPSDSTGKYVSVAKLFTIMHACM